MDFKKEAVDILAKEISLDKEAILQAIETPKSGFGDYAFPCFILSMTLKKSPMEIAKELQTKLKLTSSFEKVTAIGPYLNFYVNKDKFVEKTLKEILETKKIKEKNPKKIVIDFSHPNIAKPFSVGHLRSTVIGYSLYRILEHLGYKCIGINHLGDWGTQFGKLIYAYRTWGKEKELKKEPIKYLLSLYVKFHDEAEKNDALNDFARQEFRKLEDKNRENLKLWKEFKELSLEEFEKLYKRLDVKFDSYTGESFFYPLSEQTLKKFKKVSKQSQGALVVELEDMPPCMLRKSDEASTYALRDLAAIFYREEKYKPERILYVVGATQQLHFRQVFGAMSKVNKKLADKCIHIPFGMIKLGQEGMSSRKGHVIFMEDVLNKGEELARKLIEQKNPKLKSKDETAEKVAIASIIYSDLSNDRILDVDFSWEKMLSFDGDTGPYLQYALVRASKILQESKAKDFEIKYLNDFEFSLVKKLGQFEDAVKKAASLYKPSIIANYAYELSREFSSFYENCPVLKAIDAEKPKRLAITKAFYETLKKCLELLNIPVLGEM